jgi:DNA-binding response OmpR family regulator
MGSIRGGEAGERRFRSASIPVDVTKPTHLRPTAAAFRVFVGRQASPRALHLAFIWRGYCCGGGKETTIRVLIVEDERRIAAYVKRGLEEEGYAVDAVFTGPEALYWGGSTPYDLILLDVLLPGLNGLEVCRELRRQGCRAPILILTARGSVDDRVLGLDAGADDYLVKPFSLKELLARMRALTRRADGGDRQPVLVAGDLRMDTTTHRVSRAGPEIDLTAKEYAVLECFLREPERVLSRESIAEHVWSYDVYNQSNVVDVYVRNLRRKVDDGHERKLLQTVRGAGYRLSDGDQGDP